MNRYAWLLIVVVVLTFAGGSRCAWAQPADEWWIFDNQDFTAFRINSSADLSTSTLYAGSFPALNPTLRLQVGKRYQVTVINSSIHPFQVLAKAPSFSNDIILLSMGGTAGSFESDPDVKWTDDGQPSNGKVTFTLTQGLYNAMQDNSGGITRVPGYRCGVHVSIMRGDFEVSLLPGTRYWRLR
jgi:hypothetical protein